MTQSTGNIEPHEGIDPYNNAETQETEENQSSPLGRASGEGPAPTDAPEAGEAPELDGTAAGDPLAGLHISEADAEEAVSGDTGPEHPGVRRSS